MTGLMKERMRHNAPQALHELEGDNKVRHRVAGPFTQNIPLAQHQRQDA